LHIRVLLRPVARDVYSSRDPDLVVALHIFDEALERRNASRPADKAAMQTDREHLGPTGLTFRIEIVERVLQIGEELIAAVEAIGCAEAHVVRFERVGYDKLWPAVMRTPVR